MTDYTMNRDVLLRLSLLEGQARAFLADTTRLCEEARRVHTLSRTATAALGRHMTAALMLGAMLKSEEDSVTAVIKGSGPLGTLMAVARADLNVKGYVENPAVDPPRRGAKLDVGAAVGRPGRLTIIKDMGMREPYVGQVNLVSGEIAEDYALYFTASEQTPSLVSLGVLTGDSVQAAGGLIVQMMPGASEAAIQSIELATPMFADISATIAQFGLDGACEQLLSHLQPQLLDRGVPHYLCDCSRERIERALISLGREELQDMIEKEGGAEVGCQFCNHKYRFSAQDLQTLLDQARTDA